MSVQFYCKNVFNVQHYFPLQNAIKQCIIKKKVGEIFTSLTTPNFCTKKNEFLCNVHMFTGAYF